MNYKKIINKSIVIVAALVVFSSIGITTVIHAAGDDQGLENVGVRTEDLNIKFFELSTLPLSTGNATILSWLSFAGLLFLIAMLVLWVWLIIRAGLTAYNSQGEADKLELAYTRMKSAFVGIAITIAFPTFISILATFFGIGWVWNWPVAFMECKDPAGRYNYYFQALLDTKKTDENPVKTAHQICNTGLADKIN